MRVFEGLSNKQIATLFFGALMLIGVGYLASNAFSVVRDNHIWNGVIEAVATAVPKAAIAHDDSYAQTPHSQSADYCFEVKIGDWNGLGAARKRAVEGKLQAAVTTALRGERFSTVHVHVIHYPIPNMIHACAPSEPIYDEYFAGTVHPASAP